MKIYKVEFCYRSTEECHFNDICDEIELYLERKNLANERVKSETKE